MKKKVLFLLEAFNKGGVEKVTLDIVNHLDPEKYDITVKSIWPGGHCQSLVSPHIKVESFFPGKYIKGGHILIKHLPGNFLYRLFIRKKYDIEIAASDGRCAKIISGSSNKKSKKICWIHMDVIRNGSNLKEFKHRKTASKIFSKFNVIVPVSESCKIQFEKKIGSNYNFQTIRNSIPTKEILQKSLENISLLFKKNVVNIVSVGRLEFQKGYDRLIQVCAQLKDDGINNFHLYLIGSGSQQSNLEKLIQIKHLDLNISFLGFQGNPYPYMRNADLFCSSSRDEAFSLVVGESLVEGTPVIATNCCNITEWLNSGKYGLMVENSTQGIYNGLKELLENSNKISTYKKSIVSDFYDKDSFVKDLKHFEIGLLA